LHLAPLPPSHRRRRHRSAARAVSVAGVVLAAGGGTRFSRDRASGPEHKLLALFRGRPLVAWAVGAALGAGLDEVLVVTGAVELDGVLPAGVTLVHNEQWARGQASSLQAGIELCAQRGHVAAVVGPADQPLVPASAWRAVAGAPGGPIVVATYGGLRRNPARLDREVWSLLPAAGDEGARALMRRHPELVHEVVCEGDPADVDTLADLRAIEGAS
jgi:CTP:molybdopterin cytidylyltransferase MocA